MIATIDVGNAPSSLEYNPANENMYVANQGSGQLSSVVSVIDSDDNTVVATVEVGSDPVDLEYSPLHNSIYVANQGSDDVSVIGI